MQTDPRHPLVLAVDDDLDTRELYHLVLESVGYRVATARDVRTAAAAADAAAPSVVITDWQLPDGNGLNVLEALYDQHPLRRPSFVAISGFNLEPRTTAEALAKGFSNLLVKPVLPDDMLHAVRVAIELGTANRLRAAAERVHHEAIAVLEERAARRQDPAAPIDAALVQRAAAQSGDDIALMVADDRAHYIAAGGRTRELTGYEPEELLTMSVWDLTPPPADVSAHTLWSSFIASGSQEGRYMLRRRDGAPVEAQYCAIANIVPGLHVSAIIEANQIAAAL